MATLGMSAFMLVARRAGWLTEQAPEHITETSIERVTDEEAGGKSLDLLTAVAHLGFGAVAGAVYATTIGRRRLRSIPPAVTGAMFGTVVWVGSYWGVLPLLGLMPSPPRDERQRPQVMLVAHWIYGALLGVLSPPPREPQTTIHSERRPA